MKTFNFNYDEKIAAARSVLEEFGTSPERVEVTLKKINKPETAEEKITNLDLQHEYLKTEYNAVVGKILDLISQRGKLDQMLVENRMKKLELKEKHEKNLSNALA